VRTVDHLRERLPRAAVGTDVLVGFPGETEAAAERTLARLAGLPLSYLHVFTFSPRPGTAAEEMPDRVPGEEVRRRAAAVRGLGREMWMRFLADGVGRRHQVLIEKVRPDAASGRSREYRPVIVAGVTPEPGEVIDVVTTGLAGDALAGRSARPEAS
jgi:threonylcarbamoyladenosine tRNA methylthiotransferase MtaB